MSSSHVSRGAGRLNPCHYALLFLSLYVSRYGRSSRWVHASFTSCLMSASYGCPAYRRSEEEGDALIWLMISQGASEDFICLPDWQYTLCEVDAVTSRIRYRIYKWNQPVGQWAGRCHASRSASGRSDPCVGGRSEGISRIMTGRLSGLCSFISNPTARALNRSDA